MKPYETAVAHPDGRSTVGRLAATAARQGYGGLVVTNADREGVTVEGDHAIDVVSGVVVNAADAETAAGTLGSVRSGSDTRYTVVCVRGRTAETTRFAVGQDRVDALLLPADRDVDFDHVRAATAEDHGVRVALDLGGVLRETGRDRVAALERLRRRREILDDADATPLVTARARSHLDLRSPRDLAAVGEAVGLGSDAVRAGLAGWGAVVAHVRRVTAPEFVEPGVRRGPYEDDDRDGATDGDDADGGATGA